MYQSSSVKSAVRVLSLFELFECEKRPLRISEIVDKLDAPQSSISMLMRTLRERGYVDFNAKSRDYVPSPRLSFLGDWAAGGAANRGAIQTEMRRLADQIGETVLLGRQSGLLLQYLAIIQGQHPVRLVISTGSLRPMHRTALGIVLLSRMSDDEIGRYVRRYNAEHGKDYGSAELGETMNAINEARRNGYYCSMGMASSHAGVVACVLPTIPGHGEMALGIGGHIERVKTNWTQWLEILRSIPLFEDDRKGDKASSAPLDRA